MLVWWLSLFLIFVRYSGFQAAVMMKTKISADEFVVFLKMCVIESTLMRKLPSRKRFD